MALVLHEYLGLMGDSDLRYEISSYVLGDSVLAFLVAATVSYELRADQPHPWLCYQQVVRDLRQVANPRADLDVDEVVRKYFVAGYRMLPGSKLSKAVYLSFEDARGPGSLFVSLINLTHNLWPEPSRLAAMQKVAALFRRYARSGLPVTCKGLPVQESNGTIHGRRGHD